MTRLHQIGKWIEEYYVKFGRKPKMIPISMAEMVEIQSDSSPYDQMPSSINDRNKICGVDVETSPWADMTRRRILDIGVGRLSMDSKIDTTQFQLQQYIDPLTGHLIRQLTANILTDVTHLDVSFDWDRFAWIKRKVKWISRKWPVKRKSVRIEGKVLYPYLKIQAPADTHRVRFMVMP